MNILTQQTAPFTPPADPAFPEVQDGRAVLYTVLSDTRAGGLSLSVHHSEAHELWTRIETGTEDAEKAVAVFTRIMEARAAGDIEAEEEGYEQMDGKQLIAVRLLSHAADFRCARIRDAKDQHPGGARRAA